MEINLSSSSSFFVFLFIVSALIGTSVSQSTDCNGILVSYSYTGGKQIPPNDTTNQPYRFGFD